MTKFSQVTADNAIEILENLKGGTSEEMYHQLENLRSNVQSPEIIQQIGNIMGNLQQNSEIKTIDPSSGKPYPGHNELIDNLISHLKTIKKSEAKTMTFNFKKFSQITKIDPKKKKRGNPFRVLMGKVGKLLDHGLEKREITRYILKDKIWDEKTITRAVDIVKEYNKKKHQKVKKVEAQTLPNTAEVWPRVKPDYSKRSNSELIASICWLNSLSKIDPKKTSFAKEVADRSGVKTMIREIKSELLKRGMSEENLNLIVK